MMDMELDKNKGPRACTTCAKAKSRCIPGPAGSDKCERCHRLHKQCGSQTPAPPRAKKEPRPTKVAELEKRLDDLTSQLQTVQTAPVLYPHTPINLSHIFLPDTEGQSEARSSTGSSPDTTQYSGSNSSSGTHQATSRSSTTSWPLDTEADELLMEFKERMQPLYPFVIVPPHLNAEELAAQHPFLWKGVMMVACYLDAERQITLGNELLNEVAQAAIIKPRKSLDLLQGLQLLIAWYHYNMNSFQLTNLLFLARSMCIALGFKDSQLGAMQKEHTAHSLDLMRAYAGCYYLNTLIFTTNKQPDAFMNTAYLQVCCKVIRDKAQYPSDEFLIQLFGIQQLAQSISLTVGVESTTFQSMQLPLPMIVQSFQQQLDVFKMSLPAHLRENPIILAHVSIAEILLYEVGIAESQNTASYISLTDRLGLLWGCLNAAKTFLSIRFAPRVHEHPKFICLSASDFLYAFIVCLKLMTLNVPGWDLEMVRNHVAFCDAVDMQIADMESFVERRKRGRGNDKALPNPEANPTTVLDPFKRLTQLLKHLKVMVMKEMEQFPSHALPAPGAAVPKDTVPIIIQGIEGAFWQDVFVDQAWDVNMESDQSMTDWQY